jgi:TPR repeat protein
MTREGTINALKQKAEQGEAEAQTKLALLYYVGKGVPRNWAEAAKWFRKAADQGDAWAQLRLGDLYHLSHGVPQNDAEGAKWWRKAAERRLPFAQFSLGRRCYFGQGVPQDDAEAYFWLTLAHFHDRNLSRGYPLFIDVQVRLTPQEVEVSAELRSNLRQRLAQERISEVEERLQKWRAPE